MDIPNFLKITTEEILKLLDLKAEVSASEEKDGIFVKISGDDLGILIGYHGDTLYALQTVLSLALNKKTGEWQRVLLDVNDYRKEREGKLERIAQDAISKSRFLQKDIELVPMNSSDRRFIHLIAEKEEGVTSESVGEGFGRRVVIKPDKQKEA